MPLVGDISGSAGKSSRIGITGSVVFAGADPDIAAAFPSMGNDVAFYVSGSSGGKDHASDQGVGVFGGDLVVSGALHVTPITGAIQLPDNSAIQFGDSADATLRWDSNGTIANHYLAMQFDGNYNTGLILKNTHTGDASCRLYVRSTTSGYCLAAYNDQESDVNFNDKAVMMTDADTKGIAFMSRNDSADSTIEFYAGGNATGDKKLIVGIDQVLILSGGVATDPDESAYPDTNFFVSGSANTMGTSTKGTSVFGGDLVVSGGIKAPNKAVTTVNLGADNNDGGNGATVTQNTRSGVITVTLGAEMADNGSGFFNLKSSQLTETDVIVTCTAGTAAAFGGDHQPYLKVRAIGVQTNYWGGADPGVEIFIQNETGGAIASGQTVKFNWVAI